METRPTLKIKLTALDKAFELISIVALCFIWVLAIYYYFVLPNTIPVHINASGKPDGYGSKGAIFILPISGLFIFILMTLINKFPQLFNYPVKITAANAAKQYANGTSIIRYLKAAILLVFACMLLFTGLTATGRSNGLSALFLPFTLALILIPVVYSIVRSFKMAK